MLEARYTRVVVTLALLAGEAGCALFGANLPPGNAGPSFAVAPEGLPPLSANMRERRRALDEAARAEVRGNFALLQDLIRSSSALREQMARAKRGLEEKLASDEDITRLDKELLLEGAHWYIELDLLLYNLWTTYRRYLPYASEPDPYAPYRGASLLSPETRVKGGLVALGAEIVRMDNARVVLELLDGQWAITQFLNRGDEARGIDPESFDRMVGAYRDPDRRALIKAQLLALLEADAKERTAARLAERDGEVAYLLALLEQSPVARELVGESSLGRQARFAFAVAARSGVALLSPFLSLYIAAVLHDDIAPADALRRLAVVPGVADAMLDELEPVDVVVLRDMRRGAGVHGYTHAVVYLGEYAALKRSPLAEHVAFATHKGQLRRGRVFLDVTARGIALLSLDDVLEAQDAAVLRFPLDAEAERAALVRAFDALVERRFLTPPLMTEREHSASLLDAVLAEGLDVEKRSGDRPPPLGAIVGQAARRDDVRVVLATLDGVVMAEDERKSAIRRTLEREGPTDEVAVEAPR